MVAALACPKLSGAQQKELPEVTIATAVNNMAFSAVWVAEQLRYFDQEGVRAKITVAGGGALCLSSVVGRSTNLCASSTEGLILANLEGASLVAIQAHNRSVTLSIGVRNAIADEFKVTRKSPLNERIKVLTQLKTIGATSPGAVSEQIIKFLVRKIGGDPGKLKFVYLGGAELPVALMNNVIDAFASSPPSAEGTEAAGKGYVLISIGMGEVPELTNYPYLALMARPDWAEQNPKLASAAARAISRGGALFHSNPEQAKAALRAHRFSDPAKLDEQIFNLAYSMIVEAIPRWGDMNQDGWQKVLSFATGAGIVKDPSKAPSAKEGVLWTNKFVGKP
jgi:NitT/TauT family transport system substrate-binding protein